MTDNLRARRAKAVAAYEKAEHTRAMLEASVRELKEQERIRALIEERNAIIRTAASAQDAQQDGSASKTSAPTGKQDDRSTVEILRFRTDLPRIVKIAQNLHREGRPADALALLTEGFEGMSGEQAWALLKGEVDPVALVAEYEAIAQAEQRQRQYHDEALF